MSSFLTELKQNTHSRKSQIHVGWNNSANGGPKLSWHSTVLLSPPVVSEVRVLIVLCHNYILCYNTSSFSAWYTRHFSSCIQKPSQAVMVGFPNIESIFEDWAENENVTWSRILCFHTLSCLHTYIYIYIMCQIGLSVWTEHCTVTMICVGWVLPVGILKHTEAGLK